MVAAQVRPYPPDVSCRSVRKRERLLLISTAREVLHSVASSLASLLSQGRLSVREEKRGRSG